MFVSTHVRKHQYNQCTLQTNDQSISLKNLMQNYPNAFTLFISVVKATWSKIRYTCIMAN